MLPVDKGMHDSYHVLGVRRSASQAEIKRAYRRLAKACHPDLHPNETGHAERFKEISAAYDILGDEARRARYDRGGIGPTNGNGNDRHRQPVHGDGSASAPFEAFSFGQATTTSDRARGWQAFAPRGADVTCALDIPFETAATGGSGRLDLPSGKRLDVRIPGGIDDGEVLRLKGQGERGLGLLRAGDALVEVHVRPHPLFQRCQRDVLLDLPITLREAALGARVSVPTVDGPVALQVPPGSNASTILRLRGRGIVDRRRGGRGDQLVSLRLVLPTVPDPDIERFVAEKWTSTTDYAVHPATQR